MNTCTQCGVPITDDLPQGLCARCLLSLATKSDASAAPHPAAAGQSPGGTGAAGAVDITDAGEVARRLPQFEILEMLGRGGMGVVYKARQIHLDRMIALKILPPGDSASPDFIERFRREARSLAKLSHPNIVHLYEFGETAGLYYFFVEFVDGANLRQMIQARRMTPGEALAVVPPIYDALQFAHEEGVVHRDIKPENILIDKKGRVKIADFGLAKLLRREQNDLTLTQAGATLGTPRYMAPEQLEKPDSVDHRADIYSLGVVFYEMLTGEIPMGRFAPPSEKVQIDVRLDEIVLHAMERDVVRRYQHVSEVRDDVNQVTSSGKLRADEPQSASPVPQPPRKQIPAPARMPRFFWLGAFVALMTGWVVMGACWNFRTPGCLFASLVLGGIVMEVAFRRARENPRWLAAWQSASRFKRGNYFFQYMLMFALAFLLLTNAMMVAWEIEPLHWNFLAQSNAEFEANHKGREYQLIRDIDAFKDQVPATELAQNGFMWNGSTHLWGDSAPFHGSMGAVSAAFSLFVGAGILLFLLQQWFGAESFSFWRLHRGGWKPAMALCGMTLTSVVLIFGMIAVAGVILENHSSPSIIGVGDPQKTIKVDATTQQVNAALNDWAVHNGYAAGDQNSWNLMTVPKGERVAQAAVFTAWKPSPFDRWRMTWGGLRRISPQLGAVIVASEKPVQARAIISLGLVQVGSEQATEWGQLGDTITQAISKAPAFDGSKVAASQASAFLATSSPDIISPWVLFGAFIGLALFWTAVRLAIVANQRSRNPGIVVSFGG